MIIPNLRFGGAERSFANLSRELAMFYNVHIVIFSKHSDVDYQFGGEVIDLNIEGGKNLADKATKFWQRVSRIKELKQKLNIDLSISFLEGADYVNILSRVNDKVVVSIRGSKSHDENITGTIGLVRKRLLMPWLYNKADFIVSVTNGITQELRTDFRIKPSVPIRRIYNFYDVDEHKALSDKPIKPSLEKVFEGPVLITLGRIAPEKGLHLLLPVFAELVRQLPSVKLVIVGDGPFRHQLYQICEELGLSYYTWEKPEGNLSAQVVFLGYHVNPFRFLKRASLFVLTSSAEGFGNAIAEAMICGLPIVSVDCPSGPREILAPDTRPHAGLTKPEFAEFGILMPLLTRNQPEEVTRTWVSTLTDLLENEELKKQYSRKSRERVKDFSKGKIVSQWLEVINKLN